MAGLGQRLFRSAVVFILGGLCFSICASADVIVLKSGKELEADIIEKTDDHIVVDFYGVELTYYNDEVTEIKEDETMVNVISDSPSSFKLIMKGEKKQPQPEEEVIEEEEAKPKEEPKIEVKDEKPKGPKDTPSFISITIKGKQQWSE